MYEIACA